MEERQKILNSCEGDSVESKDHRDIESHSTLNNTALGDINLAALKKSIVC